MKPFRRILWGILIFLSFLSVGLVVRRILIILQIIPAVPVGAKFAIETRLKDYPVLTVVHIVPGLIIAILGPLLLWSNSGFYKTSGRRIPKLLFIVAGYIVGCSAIMMPFVTTPIGGLNEAAAAMVYGLIFVVAITNVMIAVVHANNAAWRQWMIRALSLSLAIASTRLIMVLAFVIGKVSAQEFLGTAFWIAFTINLWVAEIWIRGNTNRKQICQT